jgi:ribosomal protein S18 acetylase RimI-like enzyme
MSARTFEVFETRDKQALRALLSTDSVAAAYLLGDLVEPFFSQCRWLVAAYRGRLEGVVLLYSGLSVPAILSYGAPDAVEAALACFAAELPATCYAKIGLEHADFFPKYFQLEHVERLWTMGIEAAALLPPNKACSTTVLSKHTPLAPITALYSDYPGNYFEPSQLESGLYVGAFADDQLVAIAGTLVLAPAERIAVLGNIVTSATARREGYGTAVTSALVTALAARGCSTVALQVAGDNEAAVACYRNLGFRFRSIALQARAARVG